MLYDQIHNTLLKKGVNTMTGDIYDYIANWKEWYMGNVATFHYYNLKLASGLTKKCEKLTMNMPKKVCEDYAKLLWSEKVKISLDSEEKTKKFWEIIDSKKNNFSVNFPRSIERAFALGTGALVEYKVNDEIKIDYIDGDIVIPYKYDNSYISGMITISTFIEGTDKAKIYYTHLTYHEFNGTDYKKYNELYKSKVANELGKEVDFAIKFPNVENPVIIVTDTPHFQVLRPNIANNLCFDTPMGISILANHIDKFKAIDDKYDSFSNEFKLGRKRILVDKSAIKKTAQTDNTGAVTYVSYFDENDTVYQAIAGMESQPTKEIDFTLRYEEHIKSINADLNWLSAGVGLGQGFYSFEKDGLKTATEVISDNSDTYRSKVSHQIVIKDIVYDLVKSILNLAGMESKEIKVEFDDSIIEDDTARRKEGREKVTAGLLSKKSYLMDYEGMTEEEADEELLMIAEDNKQVMPEGMDFFNGGGDDTTTNTKPNTGVS